VIVGLALLRRKRKNKTILIYIYFVFMILASGYYLSSSNQAGSFLIFVIIHIIVLIGLYEIWSNSRKKRKQKASKEAH
jgi:hypothetical protein